MFTARNYLWHPYPSCVPTGLLITCTRFSCSSTLPSNSSQSTLPSPYMRASCEYSLNRSTKRSCSGQSCQQWTWQIIPSKFVIGSHFGIGANGTQRIGSPGGMGPPQRRHGYDAPAMKMCPPRRDMGSPREVATIVIVSAYEPAVPGMLPRRSWRLSHIQSGVAPRQ